MRYHGFMSKRNESDHKDKGKKFQINQTQKTPIIPFSWVY